MGKEGRGGIGGWVSGLGQEKEGGIRSSEWLPGSSGYLCVTRIDALGIVSYSTDLDQGRSVEVARIEAALTRKA